MSPDESLEDYHRSKSKRQPPAGSSYQPIILTSEQVAELIRKSPRPVYKFPRDDDH